MILQVQYLCPLIAQMIALVFSGRADAGEALPMMKRFTSGMKEPNDDPQSSSCVLGAASAPVPA